MDFSMLVEFAKSTYDIWEKQFRFYGSSYMYFQVFFQTPK